MNYYCVFAAFVVAVVSFICKVFADNIFSIYQGMNLFCQTIIFTQCQRNFYQNFIVFPIYFHAIDKNFLWENLTDLSHDKQLATGNRRSMMIWYSHIFILSFIMCKYELWQKYVYMWLVVIEKFTRTRNKYKYKK